MSKKYDTQINIIIPPEWKKNSTNSYSSHQSKPGEP